jgi:hypothetical protein
MPDSIYDFKAIREAAIAISRHALGEAEQQKCEDTQTRAECEVFDPVPCTQAPNGQLTPIPQQAQAAPNPCPPMPISKLSVCPDCGGLGFIVAPSGRRVSCVCQPLHPPGQGAQARKMP